jgi:hypothetical protein
MARRLRMGERAIVQKRKRQPLQPLGLDQHGSVRFQENRIVRYLLDNGGIDLNHLAGWCADADVPKGDQEQFAQLIGYSLSGFSELSYVRDSTYERAAEKAKRVKP